MTATQKPPRLREGMTLGIIAPSSPVAESADAARAIARFDGLGFKTVLGEHAHDKRGYLAGLDTDRADDLLTMLERDDIDAIICLRGGYGAGRLLNTLNTPERLARLRQIAGRPPKAIIGFSDITMLHALIARELGWTSFYGPVITSFKNATDYTVAAFRSALMDVAPFDDPAEPGRSIPRNDRAGDGRGPIGRRLPRIGHFVARHPLGAGSAREALLLRGCQRGAVCDR